MFFRQTLGIVLHQTGKSLSGPCATIGAKT